MFHHELIFVGDIHAQYTKMDSLLKHINASGKGDATLVFMGNLMNRNPAFDCQNLKVLRRVKGLVDQGKAYCLMGSAELHAIGFASYNSDNGKPLIPHSAVNCRQQKSFLDEVGQNTERHHYWVNWFKTLPIYLDFGDIRAIHGCWQNDYIQGITPYLDGEQSFRPSAWLSVFEFGHILNSMTDSLLQGPVLEPPYDGITQEKPVVIGHYALSGQPFCLTSKVVCVDFDVTTGDNPLIAYHWRGEREFTSQHFMSSVAEVQTA